MSHDDHHELSFWRKYVFSIDHKVIGIQYGITALLHRIKENLENYTVIFQAVRIH